jgi:hypothetical protein
MEVVNEATFLLYGRSLLGRSEEREFRSLFGVSAFVASKIWRRCGTIGSLPPGAKPKHLLWVLLFLKVYATESVHRSIVHTSRKTWRKWVWLMVPVVADLAPHLVSLPTNSVLTRDYDSQCFQCSQDSLGEQISR